MTMFYVVLTMILMGAIFFYGFKALVETRDNGDLWVVGALSTVVVIIGLAMGLYTIFSPLQQSFRTDIMVRGRTDSVERLCRVRQGHFVQLKNTDMICLNPL